MGYIKDIKIGNGTTNLIEPILYGTTNTAAGTQAKVVSISNFELVTGVTVAVKFTVTNTHATPQLNINSTGAKSIKYRGGNLPSAATLTANRVYQFVYDGTNWELIGDLDTNTQTITGVKGNAETTYRTGQVNLTPANIGAVAIDGEQTITGNKTFTNLNIHSTFNIPINTIIKTNTAEINQSPVPKYLWHDIWAFNTIVTPKYYITNDGTNWTEATLEKYLFSHKMTWGKTNIIDGQIKGSRWVWETNKFAYSSATWLVIGIAYSNTNAYFDLSLTVEDSSGAITELAHLENQYINSTPIWIKTNTPSNIVKTTLTITRNASDTTTNVLPITSLQWLASRWGDQGQGSELEYPYQWNRDWNIYPLTNNTQNLGTSSVKWANVYATKFIGNLDGTASRATGDGNGDVISSTYLKLSGGTLTGNLTISHATSATMTANSTNPKITFSESGTQPVHLIYTSYDSYRFPAGLKVVGGTNATPAWFEVEGQVYAAGFNGPLIGNVTGNVSGSAGSVALSGVTGADDLKAIEALSGTSGFLKKTAANTWTLDTNTYLTSSTGVTSVAGKTGAVTLADLGLSQALRFRGKTTTTMSDGFTGTPAISGVTYTPTVGDVVIDSSSDSEYVCVSISETTYTWERLGRDSSWALDNAVIHNELVHTKGDIIYASAANTPTRLAIGTGNNKFLTVSNGIPAWGVVSKSDVGLSNVTNDAQIPKSIFTEAYQILYSTGSSTYAVLTANKSTTKKFLRMTGADSSTGAAPAWDTVTKSDVGLGNVDNTADANKTVKYANMLTGFSGRGANFTWGNQTGTAITVMNDSTGGSVGFRQDNPTSGKLSMIIDGTVYIKEGNVNVSDAVKSFSVSGKTVTYTTLWGNTGTFTTQDTDTLVKQTSTANNANYKLLTTTSASPSSGSAAEAYYSANITANPSTGSISAQRHTLNLGGIDKAYITWNNTDQSIDFIFE